MIDEFGDLVIVLDIEDFVGCFLVYGVGFFLVIFDIICKGEFYCVNVFLIFFYLC